IANTLTGKTGTLHDLLAYLARAAHRRLLCHVPAAGSHTFVAAAMRNGESCLYKIDPLHSPFLFGPTRDRGGAPRFWLTGSGAAPALKSERLRMVRLSRLVA